MWLLQLVQLYQFDRSTGVMRLFFLSVVLGPCPLYLKQFVVVLPGVMHHHVLQIPTS